MAQRKRKAATPRKRRRKAITRARRNPGMLANPRRRRRATARKVTRRRRRSVRRNPSLGGALNLVTRGVKDAAYMVGGEMASNIVAGYIPALLKDQTGVETKTGAQLRKLISAVVVGFGAQQIFKGGDAARFMVAGALAAPIKQVIRPLLPATGVLSGALAAYPRLAAYPLPVALPAGRGVAMNGYPRRGVGCAPGADDDGSNGNGAAYGFGG